MQTTPPERPASTTRCVAFCRGINVGSRRVSGRQLCAPLEGLGLTEVATFLASGNVIFSTSDLDALEERLERALREALGFDVEVFVRTTDEIAHLATVQPFSDAVLASSVGTLQVTFLRADPGPSASAAALAHSTAQDRLVVRGREWFWLPATGISTSELDVKAVERTLGRGTTRTMRTLVRLTARLGAEDTGRGH